MKVWTALSTRNNIIQIIDCVNREYRGLSDVRGTRNYDEMKAKSNFTSIESTKMDSEN